MSISEVTMKEHRLDYVIVMKGDQTLPDAIRRLQESDYDQSITYLVVEPAKQAGELYQTGDLYLVKLFDDLYDLLQTQGGLTQPLADCPLPVAMRVEHLNTPVSDEFINRWLHSYTNSTLVVIDDTGFVGLLVYDNNMSIPEGIKGPSLFDTLPYVEGKTDCPYCKKCTGKGFEIVGNKAICNKCHYEFTIKKQVP